MRFVASFSLGRFCDEIFNITSGQLWKIKHGKACRIFVQKNGETQIILGVDIFIILLYNEKVKFIIGAIKYRFLQEKWRDITAYKRTPSSLDFWLKRRSVM